jgi:class 3 adenylate cyclase
MAPQIRYAKSGAVNIAYHVFGGGDVDLVFVPPFISNIELDWDMPSRARFTTALGRFARLISFDRRGCGASDGPAGAATLEQQLDDVGAVLDAAGARAPALISLNEGAALALLYAASHPQAVRALVLMDPEARLVAGEGYEWAPTREQRAEMMRNVIAHWGDETSANPWRGFVADEALELQALGRYQRLAAGPGDAAAALALAGEADVRDVLPSVQCPTLVLRRKDDEFIDARHSRYVAEHVPGARLVELPGSGPPWLADADEAAREIEDFLTGVRSPVPSERVLATVLFTDIVRSTERAAELGDARWRALLQRHDDLLAREVGRHRGRVVKSLGDGALAVFDGPSRALGCALAIRDGLLGLGLGTRAGLHTGECELLDGGDVGGIAVHIAARVAALASEGEVLASSTVRDLSVGSPFELRSRGEHELKGVAEPWRVFAVRAGDAEAAA